MLRMTERCPTCGRPLGLNATAVAALLSADRRRDIYLGRDGGYYISYSGGKVEDDVVAMMLSDSTLVRKFPNLDGCYVLKSK